MKMDQSKDNNNTTEVLVSPSTIKVQRYALNSGIKINNSEVKDPNDGRIYKN